MEKRTHFNKTIFLKFLLAYALFAVFGFIAIATFIRSLTYDYVRGDQAKHLYAFATQIANTYASDLYNARTSLETVQSELTALSEYLEAEIWIINPSGRMVINSAKVLSSDQEVYVEGFDPTVTGETYYTEGTFFSTFETETLSVFAPIMADYKVRAYVVAHVPVGRIAARCDEYMNICLMLMIVLFLLSLIILIFFAEMVYVPLRKITEAAEQYAAGNMDYKASVETDDEIGYLAATLSYMAGEIARAEDDQKKFIANVSHDFRSPLTSINGYLTAMSDGTIPPEQHEKYIGRVLNETERLTKLTNGLLTLNNLSTQGMLLDRTDFDINRVIRESAASFEGTCTKRGVSMDLVLTEEEMYVDADTERIRQVLYNLLDNAIKFSPDGEVIKIETTEKGNKVFVSVKDNGIGIPKDDQKLIFDRFFKSDHSRGKDKKGTGLGLSIVREIIKAHGENINVVSTVGAGTEFIFSLPLSKEMEAED